ncbi:MAG TPA: hypothetical protein DD490_10975 [Acidobacteria bacterium]|nr:hypothetical protein [Acidobacteriota bacterium]
MIQIPFDPEKLTADQKKWWSTWQKRAEKATQDVIDAWETWKATAPAGSKFSYKWKDKIWSDLKDWLLENVFHGKCAYCETKATRWSPHGEHFRPKGGVTCKIPGQEGLHVGRCTDVDGQAIDHPGYFWLAYHWWNLVPSCEKCNAGEGKQTQFPVKSAAYVLLHPVAPGGGTLKHPVRPSAQWPGYGYLHPEDLDTLEDRLLLHPYADDPRQHLVFGDRGLVAAKSERGKHSIEVYRLAAEALRQERQRAQEAALNKYLMALGAGADMKAKRANAAATLADHRAGIEPYSAAVLDYLDLAFAP